MTQERVDVAIVGGGMVGMATALACRERGLSVTVVDPGGIREAASYGNAGVISRGSIIPVAGPGILKKLPRYALNREVAMRVDYGSLLAVAPWLIAFLRRAQAEGHQLVIVITGKGAPKRLRDIDEDTFRPDPYAPRGVLRRVVPEWLSLPEMRPLVIGFEEAAPGHGGAGALYVRIRRP